MNYFDNLNNLRLDCFDNLELPGYRPAADSYHQIYIFLTQNVCLRISKQPFNIIIQYFSTKLEIFINNRSTIQDLFLSGQHNCLLIVLFCSIAPNSSCARNWTWGHVCWLLTLSRCDAVVLYNMWCVICDAVILYNMWCVICDAVILYNIYAYNRTI